MKIIDIKEVGSSNLLMWSIANGADIKSDSPLISLINDELSYMVTLSDVNFFELFRLTQMYRDRLVIVNTKQMAIPSKEQLKELFPGEIVIDKDNPESKTSLCDLAEHALQGFVNLTYQMMSDDDIINQGAVRLFIPMINRKFDIQLPISFADFVQSMSNDEIDRLFTRDYPGTLNDIITADNHDAKNTINLGFMRGTSILKYDVRYDKYIKTIKYAPLIPSRRDGLGKFGLLGFSKRNLVSRTDVALNMFKLTKDGGMSILERLSKIANPIMKVDFVIQLPLEYMQLLENSYGREILQIAYESSMSNIIDNGITFDDFNLSEYSNNSDDEVNQERYQSHLNEISAYRARINEANENLFKVLPLILESGNSSNITSVFSMLPSIYMTNAVIRISTEHLKLFTSHTDPVLSSMFKEMEHSIDGITEDLRKIRER